MIHLTACLINWLTNWLSKLIKQLLCLWPSSCTFTIVWFSVKHSKSRTFVHWPFLHPQPKRGRRKCSLLLLLLLLLLLSVFLYFYGVLARFQAMAYPISFFRPLIFIGTPSSWYQQQIYGILSSNSRISHGTVSYGTSSIYFLGYKKNICHYYCVTSPVWLLWV